ncbi:Inositol 2-dehydrogenase/D-chiro-inositol 3-dehydrogenase [Rubripirellula amarantea]|uniref:Inositol 2-dehydrogenase/D-chiro-inositol 3-dehydrogenase n=1 Tax=Rubripirellula amarantea TaxID=2527999 RepID=A0A5C5WPD4_9BACT|nr:Inositol 2-dehydrogenase/D-chiro-inositol 3-dehydrogenase [Rubripirellula amarantea]
MAIVGGGRWGRQIVSVLKPILSNEQRILWVTKHGNDAAQKWCVNNALDYVTCVPDLETIVCNIDAAIVANAPTEHYPAVSTLLEHSVPTFCEKPVTLSLHHANKLVQLAELKNVAFGTNLVLDEASYLKEFTDDCAGLSIRSIEIVWHDPWCEVRHGQTKHGDFYTPMTHDMLPHCWSIMRRILGNGFSLELLGVDYTPQCTVITCQTQDISISVSLSRRAKLRIRKIKINGSGSNEGDSAWLDFSQEPGFQSVKGQTRTNQWGDVRPLEASLRSFFSAIESDDDQWSLSTSNCLEAVQLAESASQLVEKDQDHRIRRLASKRQLSADNSDHVALLIDRLAPTLASQGQRDPLLTTEQCKRFADQCIPLVASLL